MLGVLAGFVTIGAVIGLGALLAHWRILDVNGQKTLVRLSFFVASPALIVTVLADTDVSQIFSANLVASIGSVVVAAAVWLVLARLVWRRSVGDTVIGAFGSAYVNAGNLGLPIAAYALGNASLIVPMLLTQMLILQPAGLMALDLATSKVQSMTVTGGSALGKDDISRMVKEAEEHAEEDRTRREGVELRNEADVLVFRTEKLLSENADKITELFRACKLGLSQPLL